MAKASPAHEAERRLALLKAAFREVAERGFSAVTLEDIAVRAGVSKGITLYYFDSKDDLFRELFAWLIDSIHARMRDAVGGAADPVEKVRALVALIFPSPSKNRAFFRAYIDFCGLAATSTRGSSRRGCGEASLPCATPRRRPPHCGRSSTGSCSSGSPRRIPRPRSRPIASGANGSF
jgi:AcrR family transcriptional regulator